MVNIEGFITISGFCTNQTCEKKWIWRTGERQGQHCNRATSSSPVWILYFCDNDDYMLALGKLIFIELRGIIICNPPSTSNAVVNLQKKHIERYGHIGKHSLKDFVVSGQNLEPLKANR